jgi:hypothetical protein
MHSVAEMLVIEDVEKRRVDVKGAIYSRVAKGRKPAAVGILGMCTPTAPSKGEKRSPRGRKKEQRMM